LCRHQRDPIELPADFRHRPPRNVQRLGLEQDTGRAFGGRRFFRSPPKGPQAQVLATPDPLSPHRGVRLKLPRGALGLDVSVEFEDANVDPGGCGARTRWLQRQSGVQSLVADGLQGSSPARTNFSLSDV
jgi:hypothetical protein